LYGALQNYLPELNVTTSGAIPNAAVFLVKFI